MAPRTTNFIISFDLVTLLLGVIMMAIGIYIKQTFVDGGWGAFLSLNAVWALVFGGLFMIMISFLGCYSARKNKKFLLAIYLCCVAVLMTIIIAGTAVMMGYAGYFSKTGVSGSITVQSQADVNNAVLSAFVRCCSGCIVGGTCTNPPWIGKLSNTYASWCTSAGACSPPALCTSVTQDNCFQYVGSNAGLKMVPSQFTDQTLCTLLYSTSVNGHSIVGDAASGACGGGNPSQFMSDINGYFGPKIYFAGVLFSFIAAVQGTILLVGAYIIFFVSKKDIIDDGMDTKDFRRGRDERL